MASDSKADCLKGSMSSYTVVVLFLIIRQVLRARQPALLCLDFVLPPSPPPPITDMNITDVSDIRKDSVQTEARMVYVPRTPSGFVTHVILSCTFDVQEGVMIGRRCSLSLFSQNVPADMLGR